MARTPLEGDIAEISAKKDGLDVFLGRIFAIVATTLIFRGYEMKAQTLRII